METFQHRRKATTYGKSRKKLYLDNIFDHEIVSASGIGAEDLLMQGQPKGSTTLKRTPNGMTVQRHLSAANSRDQVVRVVSPLTSDQRQDSSDSASSLSSLQNESAGSSILDMLDSDEEACTQEIQKVDIKRRKITSLSNNSRSVQGGRVQKREQAPVAALKESQKHRNAVTSQKKRADPRQTKEVIRENNLRHAHAPEPQEQVSKQPLAGPRTASRNRQMTSSNQSSLVATGPSSNSENSQQKNGVDEDQERLAVHRSAPETPKARRALQRRNQISRSVASPGQLGLTSLRLTPDKNHPSRSASPENGAVTPRRIRHKLTDRLDAPEGEVRIQALSLELDADMVMQAGENSNARRTLVPQHRLPAPATLADVPASPKTTRVVSDRSRLTYAKERSHLSDMVVEVGDLRDLPNSRLVSSMPISPLGRINQVAVDSQALEDSDEVSAANAVKSIHELRQAGINNRFERDMETHFEDIEPRSNPSKALRTQALLQLIQKLKRPGLARQFIEVGMTRRLAECAEVDLDTISAILLVHAISSLLVLNHMSVQHVLAAFQAIVILSPNLLTHSESFNKLATDRKQNLSKALSRELVAFGKSTQIEPWSGTIQWTPQHVAIFALEQSLRIIRELRAVPADFPAALFNQILVVLTTVCEKEVNSETQPQMVTAALTILEFSAAYQLPLEHEDGLNIALNYRMLADLVIGLMANSPLEDADLRSIALRLIVSLTNNEPRVCAALAVTGLIPTVFAVVQEEFPRLSEDADRGNEFDTSTLDMVIMALGCLLNLADCSSEARKQMYALSNTKSNGLHWLVSVFNQRAGKAEEVRTCPCCRENQLTLLKATTIAQSQVLVAFGYMSMLLCTLCLDSEVYDYVAALIQGHTVTALCIEAEEFLDKLETVASLNPDDPATATFNQRFRSILLGLSTRIS
jgi:hypothetical protein